MKISIITVCFNSKVTIEECMNSVLNLNGINDSYSLEYIVIDGLSTDGTLEIIQSFEGKFEEKEIDFSYKSEKDKGIYDAWNKGVKLCSGDLIGILSSDDYFLKNSVLDVVSASNNLSGNYIITGLRNQITFEGKYKDTKGYRRPLNVNIKWRMPINFTATFISNGVYEKIGYYNDAYRLSADYEFIYKAVIKEIPFYFIDSVIINMRDGGATYKSSNLVLSAKEDNSIRKSMGVNIFLSNYIYIKRNIEILAIRFRNNFLK
ncbi:glycosyltransferase family 2 protein [uncultured Maribacter sp.]|uniref:glycosyltransferase family 2 protein n=1 Tax=uncultured Maribacter sp. TaxID=431308 RepID=UPI0026347426|nr:glycosyltransferase family 2 protein [uncultured Maribacter sp.]